MPKTDANVPVVRRALFDILGAFQGLQRDADRYLAAFLKGENNFFELRKHREKLETWLQIVLDAWETRSLGLWMGLQ